MDVVVYDPVYPGYDVVVEEPIIVVDPYIDPLYVEPVYYPATSNMGYGRGMLHYIYNNNIIDNAFQFNSIMVNLIQLLQTITKRQSWPKRAVGGGHAQLFLL